MNRNKGFSLVELAVALAIIALLLAGALIPLSAQVEVRNVADTQRTMESIREAIIGFAQVNGRLPCAAVGATPAGAVNAGREQCPMAFGVVPWATLGVPEVDGWGRRFSYWVSPNFTDAIGTTFGCVLPAPTPAPTQSSFALCSQGTYTINTRLDSDHAVQTPVGLLLPAVIISHGKNGSGAFTPSGSNVAAPQGPDEITNASHAVSTTFISRTATSFEPSILNPACSETDTTKPFCAFDDIVMMIHLNALMARMVAAGKLP